MSLDNYISVENLLQNRAGKRNAEKKPVEGNYIAYMQKDVLIGNIRPYLKKIWFADRNGGTNGDVLVVRPNADLVYPRYIYHVLSSDDFFNYDNSNSKGAKMPRGDKEAVLKYNMSLPTFERQKEISNILDRFDKLCNDISEGLPAEIESRQKQYEYYRDKLLSFEPLNTEKVA